MKAIIRSIMDVSLERAIEEVQKPELLMYVNRGFVDFTPKDPKKLPEVWEEGEYKMDMKIWGFIPIGEQRIVIEIPEQEEGEFRIRDNGSGELMEVWDHFIIMRRKDDNSIHYTDEIELKAGLATPFVWLFTKAFYRHRQRRWKKLIRNDFDYSG